MAVESSETHGSLHALSMVFIEVRGRLLAIDMDQIFRITSLDAGVSAGVNVLFTEKLFPESISPKFMKPESMKPEPAQINNPETERGTAGPDACDATDKKKGCGSKVSGADRHPVRCLWIRGTDPTCGITADNLVEMTTIDIERINAMPPLIQRVQTKNSFTGLFWGTVTYEGRIALLLDACRMGETGCF